MEYYQKVIIDLLKESINRKKIVFDKGNIIEWNKVVNETKQHKINSLIYYSIDRNSLKYIDNNILYQWKQEILKDNLIQIRHINIISKLVNDLSEQGLEVILLKGLVIRNIYPRPEFRTMCDADILVKPEDYLNVKSYLIKNGYKCSESNHPIHADFMCLNQLLIEIHWKLMNDNCFNGNTREFEENVWKRAVEINICGVNCKTLCNEDFLIYMCLHMAIHAKYKGVGLRQLYDVAVFIKNNDIEWASFCSKIYLYGISKFTKGIFKILQELLDINMPENIFINENIDNQEIQLLLCNILAYGEKEEIDVYDLLFQRDVNEKYIRKISKLLFPTRSELSYTYKYAKENVLLLPIAWIHRAIRGISIRRYGFIKMIKYYKSTVNLINKRKEIIKIFEL